MKTFDSATLQARRERLSLALNSHINEEDLILFYAGEPIQKPGGLDQTYPYLPHPEYFWLTGLRRPLGILAYCRGEGWMDFVQLPTLSEKLWEGGADDDITGVDISKFEDWLKRHPFKRIFALGQVSTFAKSVLRPLGLVEEAGSLIQLQEIQEVVNHARRPKDAAEVALIQKVARMAEAGYRKLASVLRPGLTERELQIEYEAEVLRAGAEKFPYDTIVGSGVNAAVLHAIPTGKRIGENELVLVDAGADLFDYCVDITRTFSSTGAFTSQQREIYDLVLKAQRAAIELCRPGVEWRRVHETAARVLAEGLKDLGILTCDADTALASEAISVFLPHGVGHLVGLKVRDVGGIAGQPVRTCCGVRLRVDLPLEENFVMTVEPGLYFVPALLDQAETRTRFKTEINWNEVDKWKTFGGIRIEDDVLIKAGGVENLTAGVAKA